MAPPPKSHEPADEPLQDYLRSVDLDGLDLAHIDLDADAPSPLWRYVQAGVLLGCVAALAVLPGTSFYQLHPAAGWLWYGLAVVALALGYSLLPQLLQLGTALQQRGTQLQVPRWALPRLPAIPPAWYRPLMFCGFVGLGSIVYFAMPREAQWQGSGYSGSWFGAVGLALVSGILGGRWLILQAEAARERSQLRDVAPFVAPPWLKWVTLALLVGGGLFASFGHRLWGVESENAGFTTAGVGFAVGIFAAIWLARRFEELEAQGPARARRRTPPAPPPELPE